MEIAFHLGAHCTDEGAVLRVLRRNHLMLAEQAIHVPPPEDYPPLLRLAAQGFAGRGIPEADRSAVLARLSAAEAAQPQPERLVLSFESFLGFSQDAATPDALYPATQSRAAVLGGIFAGHSLQIALCLRNPATLLPALNAKRRAKNLAPLELSPSAALRWSTVVSALRSALPEARLTLWCDEDAPLIWHRLLRSLAGFDEASELAGVLDYPASFLAQSGSAARDMQAWFAAMRPHHDSARTEAIRDWLGRSVASLPRVASGLPGWSPRDVASVNAAYNHDCARIAQMPGVTFLLP